MTPFNLDEHKNSFFHFIGCGGAGMAPLALIFHEKGFKTSGSDLEESGNTKILRSRGIDVRIGHSADNLPDKNGNTVIVRSSAVNEKNPEFARALELGWPCLLRGEMLAVAANSFKRAVAVSGSHGKKSVTGMIAHILSGAGLRPGFMVGGKVRGWPCSAAAGNGDIFVTEADESDGTHSLLSPWLGVVPNVEDDHCWSVGGEKALLDNFRKFAASSENLLCVPSVPVDALFKDMKNRVPFDPSAEKFGLLGADGGLLDPGNFQKLNMALAVKAAELLGVERLAAEKLVLTFPGIERRMTLHAENKDLALMEDYAHHPTELRSSLAAMRKKYPGRHLRVVFQPHRYARLKRYVNGFAEELGKCDSLVITPVFAAWVEKDSLTAEDLAKKIGPKAEYCALPWQDMAAKAMENLPRPALLSVIGAGDVDQILPFLKAKM